MANILFVETKTPSNSNGSQVKQFAYILLPIEKYKVRKKYIKNN